MNELGQAVGYLLYPPGSALAFQTVIWNLRDAAIVSLGEQLSAAVAAGLLSEGSARSLESKLEAAEAAMGRGNATAAANILRAFRQHVVAQSGKHIPASLAQGLVSASALALATID